MDVLETKLKPGEIVTLPTGKKYRFVDQWAGKNKVNSGMYVRKYEFEPVTDP